jgi:hypothetical protein
VHGVRGGATSAVDHAGARLGHRWKLVGNAVPVPMAAWVGRRLREPGRYDARADRGLQPGDSWPSAAWGSGGVAYRAVVSTWPIAAPCHHLEEARALDGLRSWAVAETGPQQLSQSGPSFTAGVHRSAKGEDPWAVVGAQAYGAVRSGAVMLVHVTPVPADTAHGSNVRRVAYAK